MATRIVPLFGDSSKVGKEVFMFRKQLIMVFLAGAVVVSSGLLIVGHLEGGTPQAVHRSSQTVAPQPKATAAQHMVVHQLMAKPLGEPIAYGYIEGSGKVIAGSGNFTCEWRGSSYYISITNVNYVEQAYLTFVTPAHYAALSPTTGQGDTTPNGTELRISFTIWNGAYQGAAFQFITYKIP
jgi:hypothetical protein